jgi:hypothetical protein
MTAKTERPGGGLKHSVAFRVTEREWSAIARVAKERKITASQLAKLVVFEFVGLEPRAPWHRTG